MMRVLGIKRVLLLLFLLVANVLCAAAVYGYMLPEKIKAERNLRSLKGKITGVQSDIEGLQIEFDQLELQQAQFKSLEKDGFFRAQHRRQAQDLFERIQESSDVISAVANISPGKVEDHVEAQKAGYKILVSPIELKIEALDDVEVYRYLYLLEKTFPGHITVSKVNLKRFQNINAAILRSIATGNSPTLVEARVDLLWRSMIQESQIRNVDGN